MLLFTEQINSWEEWGNVFCSISAFAPLVEYIFEREKLPVAKMEKLTPGTNAVFKVGDYVVKIFAPPRLGEDFGTDVAVELFGMRWAERQGVPSPKLVAHGVVEDKYYFEYLVMAYIHGKLLSEVEDSLSDADKVIIGQQVRAITDQLNRPCEKFTPIDVMQYALETEDWDKEGFPVSFQRERLAYLSHFCMTDKEKVYCHGDLHIENILVDEELGVYIIDFADAMYAPAEHEEAYIVSGLFCFDKAYLMGYYGNYEVNDVVDLCMAWLPIHTWGHATVAANLKPVDEIVSFDVMRQRLFALVAREKEK